MIRRSLRKAALSWASGAVLLLLCAGTSLASVRNRPTTLSDEVRHQLIMLPYYDVFDFLSFTMDNSSTVTLTGQVTRPTLKSDAEKAVRSIPGISRVINNIEVLPLSAFDDRIREAAYRAIFSRPGFERYALSASPSIRIIVKNGDVTLEGVVSNALDKRMAEIAARLVPGVFSVTDDLKVS